VRLVEEDLEEVAAAHDRLLLRQRVPQRAGPLAVLRERRVQGGARHVQLVAGPADLAADRELRLPLGVEHDGVPFRRPERGAAVRGRQDHERIGEVFPDPGGHEAAPGQCLVRELEPRGVVVGAGEPRQRLGQLPGGPEEAVAHHHAR
jgi:hypothetical protein